MGLDRGGKSGHSHLCGTSIHGDAIRPTTSPKGRLHEMQVTSQPPRTSFPSKSGENDGAESVAAVAAVVEIAGFEDSHGSQEGEGEEELAELETRSVNGRALAFPAQTYVHDWKLQHHCWGLEASESEGVDVGSLRGLELDLMCD